MIFDKRSNSMLKYEKSKSKLVEFSVAMESYPKYPLNPDDLTYTTIYALSRFCEELIENPTSEQLSQLKNQLAVVSQYYDSTVKTKLRDKYSKLFLILGSTAYFLSENFGSSKVLIEQINDLETGESVIGLLHISLYFLLIGKWIKASTENKYYTLFLDALRSHFEIGTSPQAIFSILYKIRDDVYKSNEIFDITYIDCLFGVIICAIDHSAWLLLPEYSDLSFEQWKDYLTKPRSIKLLWPAQKIILQAGALYKKSLVIPLPTGVGKTKSIEFMLRSKFMEQGTCTAVIIAPLRALCNEITTDLSSVFIDELVAVNQFTDTAQEDFDLTLNNNQKSVFICTPEKFSYILRHEPGFLECIQLFIFDEAHLFDDTSRGAQYELLVSDIMRNRNESSQVVLFSAVLANSSQISEWLFNDKSAIIDYSLVKSTEKSIGFISSDRTIHYYEKDNMGDESFYVPKSIVISELGLLGKETKRRLFPEKDSQDIAIYYASKLCKQGGVAIYAGQARSIPKIMRRIIDIYERGYDLSNLIINGNKTEVSNLSNYFSLHYGETYELTKASKLGAFPHYRGLPNGLKMAIEYALRRRYISFIVCTTTLAEGVNIPIKYLFLTTFSFGTSSIQIRKIQNMVGRTARAGIHTEGSAIITDPKIYDNRFNIKNGGNYKWDDSKKMFDYTNTEECTSAILSLVSDMALDYQLFYKAESLITFLTENYSNPICFLMLEGIILSGYKQNVNDGRYNRYCKEISIKVLQIKNIIENIENYLLYVFNSLESNEQFIEIVNELTTQTLAYFLGNAKQRNGLDEIFNLVAQNIISKVNLDNKNYLAKSVYGIDISQQILSWTDDNMEMLEECAYDQILYYIIQLFKNLFHNKIKEDIDLVIAISQLWIDGLTYVEICKKFDDEIKISGIEILCSDIISYHLSFMIGNICDAIGNRSDNLKDRFKLLQKMIKYGVSTRFETLICENIFDDRIIAKQINKLIGKELSTEKELKIYMMEERVNIIQILKPYPEFFSYKFRMYIRNGD